MKKEAEEKVFTNWTVKELIGKGSFGRVYRIEREEFGTTYQAAMKKIVIPQSQEDIEDAVNEGMDEKSVTSYFQSFVEEIVNEFRLMSQLKGHTNIVSYEDHMVIPHEDGIGWDILIRMELLKSLKSVTAEQNMTEAEVIKLGMDMCSALEICGKMNIIHRDIKPENIFVTTFGEYKLGDFGIARTAEKTMSNLSKKGTYTYMAPEVYKGEEYNATADIYSLGLVMYRFMNYNRAPFLPAYPQPISFSDREASLSKRISDAPMLPPACGSKELKRIILKACAYRPAARYQSPAEMRSDLEKLLQNGNANDDPVPSLVYNMDAAPQEEEEMTVTTAGAAPVEEPVMPAAAPATQEEEEDVTVSVFGTQVERAPQPSVQPQPQVQPQLQPQAQSQNAPEQPKKKKTGLFIGIGAAAVVLVVVCIIAFSRAGGSAAPTYDNDNLFDGIDGLDEASAIGTGEKDEIVISSNEYLYGQYVIRGLGLLDWDQDTTFFEGMESIRVGERDMAVIPSELYCFPEGSVYNTPFLRELLDEVGSDGIRGYASRTYIGDDTGEDIFEAIACTLFGDEITPQIHDFYVENIEGQRDTAEVVFVDELKNRESRIGYYKIDGNVMDFAYLDLDASGNLTLCPVAYEVSFSGDDLNLSNNGITRTMEPYRVSERIQVYGYASSEADTYEGISYIFASVSEDRGQFSIYFADGWRADGVVGELGEGNTMTISWEQQAKLGDPNEKRVGEGTITATYLDCGNLGLILHIDGKDYFYQKTATEYYASLMGDSVIDTELDTDALEAMEMTYREIIASIEEAFKAEGFSVGEDVIIDEKTGRITLDDGVLFDVDSAELSDGGREYLNRIFLALDQALFENDYEEYLDEIIVEGHTDSTGNYDDNQILSEERAAAVDDYCYEIYPHVSNYIDAVGRSSDDLIYDESGNEDRDASRRVVFRITLDAEVFADGMDEDDADEESPMDAARMQLLSDLKESFLDAGAFTEGDGIDIAIDDEDSVIALKLDYDNFFDENSEVLSEEGKQYLTIFFMALDEIVYQEGYEEYLDEIYVMAYSDDQVLCEGRSAAVESYCGDSYPDVSSYLYMSGLSGYDLADGGESGHDDEDARKRLAFMITLDPDAFR